MDDYDDYNEEKEKWTKRLWILILAISFAVIGIIVVSSIKGNFLTGVREAAINDETKFDNYKKMADDTGEVVSTLKKKEIDADVIKEMDDVGDIIEVTDKEIILDNGKGRKKYSLDLTAFGDAKKSEILKEIKGFSYLYIKEEEKGEVLYTPKGKSLTDYLDGKAKGE